MQNKISNFDDVYEILKKYDDILESKFFNSNKLVNRKVEKRIPCIILIGPSSCGKSTIIKKFAKENGYKYKVIELALIIPELFDGISIIKSNILDPTKLNINSKIVKYYLPDQNSQDKWIIIFEEDNLDSKKINFFKNFINNGSIGTNYHFPEKTIFSIESNSIDNKSIIELEQFNFRSEDNMIITIYMDVNWVEVAKWARELHTEEVKEDGKKVKYKISIAPRYLTTWLLAKTADE